MSSGKSKEDSRAFALTDDLAEADLRLRRLLEQQETNAPDMLLPEAMQELSTFMEELRVADEELRRQNDLLVARQHEVEQERQRYRDLFEFAPDGYLVTDLHGTILEANRAISHMLQVRMNYLVGKPIIVMIRKDYYREIHRKLSEHSTNPDGFNAEITLKPRKGPEIDVSVKVAAVFGTNHTPQHLMWQLRDVTERNHILNDLKRSEEDNRRKSAELSELNRRLFETQEKERHAVARELHDEIGQSLTGIKLALAAMNSDNGMAVAASMDAVDRLIGQVRNLALDLRPAMLDDLGLVPALLWHFKRFTQQTNINVTFFHHNCENRMGADVETAAYRIIQEALTNVARYAGIDEVTVDIRVENASLEIVIRDSGNGFDWGPAEAGPQSFGLTGIMERAALVGGQLDIQSSTGEGCTIRATLPFNEGRNHGEYSPS